MQRFFSILILLFLTSLATRSQTLPAASHKEVYSDGFYISASSFDYKDATLRIVGDATTAYDRARAIYLWLCDSIAYDTGGSIRTADQCWQERKGVCQGYCELFYRMAETVGLKTKLVYGLCKHPTDAASEKHVWLSVKAEQGPMLIDPTWGAGMIVNGEFVRHPLSMMWFDTDPEWFAFTHLPQHKRNQHLEIPLRDGDFARLPYLSPLAEALGLPPAEVMARALTEGTDFVTIPTMSADFLQKIRLVSVPCQRHLTTGTPYTFRIEKLQQDCTLSIVNEAGAYDEATWTRRGRTYQLTLSPKWKGKLCLVVTCGNPLHPSRKTVLEYEVKGGEGN